MGNNSIYAQFVFYIVGIAGNIFGVYVASRWLVATRRRENEIKKIKFQIGVIAEHLIDRHILTPGSLQGAFDNED